MKTCLILLVFMICRFQLSAQGNSQSETYIKWYNGDVTSLKDLGKVYINMRQGSDVTKARIWSIDEKAGKITYEKEGCLHDKNMAAIKFIGADKNSRHVIVFGQNNIPEIVDNNSFDYTLDPSDLKVTKTAYELSKEKLKKDSVITQKKVYTEVPVFTQANDTVVKANGEVIPARIIHMNKDEVRYKRADLLDGPIYNLANSPYTEVIRYNNGVKVILKH